LPALAALVAATLSWPTFAQRGESSTDDVIRAKEMARLIGQGQLNLRDAAEVAEKHVKGVALEAACDISTAPMGQSKEGGPGDDAAQASAPRLVYKVNCIAGDKILGVQVDGLTRKVVDSKDRPIPESGGGRP
jgi:hypothetical protein